MAIVVAVLAGLGIEKGIELVFDGATKVFSRSLHFNSSVRDFTYGVDYLEQHIEPVDDQNRELNRTIQKARGLLNKCRNVSRWNIIKRHRYTTKLLASRKALRIHVRILVLELRHQILELSRRYGDKSVESANVENEILHLERYLAMVEENGIMNYLVPSFNGGMCVPLKDVPSINPKDDHITIKASSFHVGLDVPLRELKKKLFTDGVQKWCKNVVSFVTVPVHKSSLVEDLIGSFHFFCVVVNSGNFHLIKPRSLIENIYTLLLKHYRV